MGKNKKVEINDELLYALKDLKNNSDFFRNSSFQGSELSTESMTTSARYLCNNIKKEAEKKYCSKVYANVSKVKYHSSELGKTIYSISEYGFINGEEEKNLLKQFPNLKQQIDDTYSDIEEMQKQINKIDWKDISKSFSKCKDYLDGVRVDGKKINSFYDNYISIVDKISKRI